MKNYRSSRTALLYILPALLIVVCMVFLPIILNLYNSFFRWNSFGTEKVFVGFDYYLRLFKDPVFYTALKNNALYAIISLIFQVGLGIIIAAILEDKLIRRFQPFFRTVFFIPSVISIAVVGLLWQLLYNPEVGLVNGTLEAIGLSEWTHSWLGDSKTAIYAVVAVSQWQYTGYMTMLFLIAMQKIPDEYYEAAMIDGASRIKSFFHITLPQIREMILVGSVITVIGAFKVFDEVYVMTFGGPGRSTEVLGTMLYRSAFRNDEMGYASTIGTVIFVITLTLSLIQMKIGKTGKEV
ncbi:sugar ABC transporter permease [Metabacillus litoralis]|uniref:carbohydrate ABC transporter permease n=1 Tax=Metabacillus TaxID=2675233 RepID=UPI000EF61E71|nr:sugar ABC transporter permease [Metabacillus litoralis]MCM3163214.1 sugar ABC transporter permease [Metabacillus litoralis]MCM3409619.1 sugar ABC transporter permease [Metabacillus litoralis]UHA58806.1 sugar ABC transporter permease [Metabacillus litoralis]